MLILQLALLVYLTVVFQQTFNLIYLIEVLLKLCLVYLKLQIDAFKFSKVSFDLLKAPDLFLNVRDVSHLLVRSILLASTLNLLQ